jgi:dihydrofolate reductase
MTVCRVWCVPPVGPQFLAARLVDEMQIHVAPVLLGDGKRLFEHFGGTMPRLEQGPVRSSPHATHIRYRLTWV